MYMKRLFSKGQVAMTLPVIISIMGTVGAGVAWTYSQISAITVSAAQTNTQVAVQANEINQLILSNQATQQSLNTLNKNVTLLLIHNNITPAN